METDNKKNQVINIINRSSLSIDYVKTIDAFAEDFLEINTELGAINIEGENLKIEEFTQESGKIIVIGTINSVFYKKEKRRTKFAK